MEVSTLDHHRLLNGLSELIYDQTDNAVVDMGDGWSGGGIGKFMTRHATIRMGSATDLMAFVGVYFLWRGAYLSKQVSLRTRALLAFDWVKGYVRSSIQLATKTFNSRSET